MPNIRSIDMLFLDDLFSMGGYVLNFTTGPCCSLAPTAVASVPSPSTR